MDETNLIEFKSYRFPDKKFILSKEELKRFRMLEREIIKKEAGLFELIKDKVILEE